MSLVTSYLFRLPYGVPGDISRMAGLAKVKGEVYGATAFPQFGMPAKLSSGTVIPLSAIGDSVYGMLVRTYPVTGPNSSDPLGTSTPPTVSSLANLPQIASILLGGYINVLVNVGAASVAEGGAVYVWIAASSGSHVQGGIEGAATAGSTLVIPGAYFTGPADSNGISEIAFNL